MSRSAEEWTLQRAFPCRFRNRSEGKKMGARESVGASRIRQTHRSELQQDETRERVALPKKHEQRPSLANRLIHHPGELDGVFQEAEGASLCLAMRLSLASYQTRGLANDCGFHSGRAQSKHVRIQLDRIRSRAAATGCSHGREPVDRDATQSRSPRRGRQDVER